MNTAWSSGYASFSDTGTGTGTLTATFAADPAAVPIIGTLKFGNKDAAAFHRFKGFTSAVITDANLAAATKESLAKALENGKSLRDWRKDVDSLFDAQGVTRLNPFQAERIYRNETAMAFGAGKFAKLQDVSERFPFWEYSTAGDERVRDTHRALQGKVFKSSDSQYYPPLGFNCRCTAIPISRLQADKRGITKPDTVTPEMRSQLVDAEFIGDKVGNYADWLNVKMQELSAEAVQLITDELTIINQQIIDQQLIDNATTQP